MTDLILVPTLGELERVEGRLGTEVPSARLDVCGFGMVSAAAKTAALIAEDRPQRVMLIGIAGTYDRSELPPGEACCFDRVACDGIGVGLGEQFVGAETLGWKQHAADRHRPTVGDEVDCDVRDFPADARRLQLLSVCAASRNAEEADLRRRRYPAAIAEDMEGFGVALACSLSRLPCCIVRGISNVVGDRDHGNWCIDESLNGAADLLIQAITARSRRSDPFESS